MKKSLLTAFVMASVLAFNACKKEEGPQGPAGPAGPAGPQGPAGAQGPVGPAGAAGKDGTTIRSGAGAPAASLGNVGDFYFDKTDRLLYGPKTEANGWGAAADAVTLYGPAGPAGADGADGKDGSSFTAGAGAPTAAVGKEGDFYFDTTTSTFYGPKGATDWSTGSVLPLSTKGSKTYYYVAGFDITEEDVEYGEVIESTYSDYALFSSYKVNEEDLYRIARYSNWHLNREMMFESTAGSGVFDYVPQGADDFADPANQSVSVITGSATRADGGALITIGQEFKYTGSTEAEANHTFSITADDINRLAVNNGQAFRYLVYAATKKEDIKLGENLTFFQKKSLVKKSNPNQFYAEYKARTVVDVETLVPNFEKLKKEGAYVFVGYNYFDADGDVIDDYSSVDGRGHINITNHLVSYFKGGVAYGNGYTSSANNKSTGHTGGGAAWSVLANNPYVAAHPTFGGPIGQAAWTFAPNQVATPVLTASQTHYNNGKLQITWDITSGVNIPNGGYDISPLTMTNPTGASLEGWWAAGAWAVRTFETEYYTAPRYDAPGLTIGTGAAPTRFYDPVRDEYVLIPGAAGKSWVSGVKLHHGGLTAEEWEAKKLLRLVVNIVDAEVVAKAKAAGINVNNPEALVNFAKSLQLQ